MYNISDATSCWTFETHSYKEKKSYLTLKGHSMLKDSPRDVLKVLRANCYDESLSNSIKIGDIIFGPLSYPQYRVKIRNTKRWCNLYKATTTDQFKIIKNTDKNIKNAEKNNLEMIDLVWFRFKHGNDQLYFYSSKFKNICKTSIYWTLLGEEYLINRREQYIFIRDNPNKFGPHQCKSYKVLPRCWV